MRAGAVEAGRAWARLRAAAADMSDLKLFKLAWRDMMAVTGSDEDAVCRVTGREEDQGRLLGSTCVALLRDVSEELQAMNVFLCEDSWRWQS